MAARIQLIRPTFCKFVLAFEWYSQLSEMLNLSMRHWMVHEFKIKLLLAGTAKV